MLREFSCDLTYLSSALFSPRIFVLTFCTDVKTDKKKDVEVRIGPAIKKKPDKYQSEIEASIKRKINRRKKENQLMMHKVHVLSWIAYGNFVNKILNSTKLMEMVVKYIPSENSYPKGIRRLINIFVFL